MDARASSSRRSAPDYDRWGAVLSFGQDPRWRRFLVSQIDAGPFDTRARRRDRHRRSSRASSSARRTATSSASTRAPRCSRRGGAGCCSRRQREGSTCSWATRARLPFDDGQFDALTFTYLLRYVDDPAASCASSRGSSSRAARSRGSSSACRSASGGRSGSSGRASGYRRAGRLIGDGWHEVGAFLGPSIRGTTRSGRLPRLLAGVARRGDRRRACATAQPRRRSGDVGTTREGVVSPRSTRSSGRLARLRDSPPSALHALAPLLRRRSAQRSPRTSALDRMLWTIAAFALALGVAAHALDELNGPSAADADPGRVLVALAAVASPVPSRSASARRPPGALACSSSSRSARCSCPPTTSSFGACTTTGGSRSPGARSRSSPAYFVEAQTLRVEAIAAAGYRDRAEPRPAHALDAGPGRAPQAIHHGGSGAARACAPPALLGYHAARRRSCRGTPTMNA